jgi:hypothetical protein
MKLLVTITKGRDIEQFDNTIKHSLENFDKMFCCYFTSRTARLIIKDQFLKNKEYTHLAILPDDLLVTKKDIDFLIYEDLVNYPDLPVLCGCCNVDNTKNKDCLNISLELPSPIRIAGGHNDYVWIKEGSDAHKVLLAQQQPTVVRFAGDPFFIFRRDIVEMLSFENDSKYNTLTSKDEGCCEDIVICNELANKNIPIYCDLRARMHHLKISDQESLKQLQVGKKEPYVEWVKAVV